LAHSPVFQVMFAWQNAPEGTFELPGLQLQPVGAEATAIKFDLELSLQEAGDCIAGSLGYASALFDRASVERHIAHWQTLLRALVGDDQAIVARLPLLSADERLQLLHGFNDTAAPFPAEHCIHELFESQAERTPEATALVFEDDSLSYAELNAQANQLAHHLIALGVQPDTRVAIALPRGIEMVMALLATLKAGGAYVPLDPNCPAERLAFMLADSAPRVLVTQSGVRATLGELPSSLAVLALDAPDRPWEAGPAVNPDPRTLGLTSAHLAYVIYTSGSTGRPKGAMNAHHAVVNRLLWMQQAYGLGCHDAVLQKTPFGFDVSVWEFFWPWLNGARLVLARPGGQRDAHYLVDLIEREQLTTLHFVPSMLSAFLGALPEGGCASLRRILCSGEALGAHEVRMVHERLPQAPLYNLYGPTEAAVDVTACEPQPGAPVTIGAPIANTRIYVLDAQGQPVPLGVAGEIHIGGVQVGRGYLNRPELTAERFVPDPFAAEPGARMYRTGDLGRWRIDPHGDGTIEFLGRNDHQVKIRGFRIELGEIEARLREHPGVREAVVLAREDEPGHPRLVAYVVGEPAQPEALPETLRTHLASALPEYMVPAAYVGLDALPLTPNGKLDRRALRLRRTPPTASTPTRHRKANSNPPSPRSGRSCWPCSALAAPTTSSRSVGTRCWRSG
ncbi:MAG: amino acid adenylation domain-containing protein, partial [Burkholderiales bacterium]|nr:amino acid adenylation domain-containing protein [Burkholderiales bacterium]